MVGGGGGAGAGKAGDWVVGLGALLADHVRPATITQPAVATRLIRAVPLKIGV